MFLPLPADAGVPVKIRACDTMGYGINYPGAVIPRSIPGIIYGIMVHAGVPSELIEFHGHNDFYKAVSNSTTAWLYGACGVNCSLFGIGERTGNTPLEAMVFEYAQLPFIHADLVIVYLITYLHAQLLSLGTSTQYLHM